LGKKQETVAGSAKPAPPANTAGTTSNGISEKVNSYGLIIGISVGAGGVVIGVTIGLITYFRLKGKRKSNSDEDDVEQSEEVRKPTPSPVSKPPPVSSPPVSKPPPVSSPLPANPSPNEDVNTEDIPNANIGENIRTTTFGTTGPDGDTGYVISI
jgi:cell division septation protein DedD